MQPGRMLERLTTNTWNLIFGSAVSRPAPSLVLKRTGFVSDVTDVPYVVRGYDI